MPPLDVAITTETFIFVSRHPRMPKHEIASVLVLGRFYFKLRQSKRVFTGAPAIVKVILIIMGRARLGRLLSDLTSLKKCLKPLQSCLVFDCKAGIMRGAPFL